MKKADLEAKLKQWATAARKQQAIAADQEAKIKPHRDEFDRQVRAIQEADETELEKANKDAAKFAKEITDALLAQIKPGKTTRITMLETTLALATLGTDKGKRRIDPREFFDNVPEEDRAGDLYFACFEILIKNSAAFLDPAIMATIARAKETPVVSLTLKK